MSLYIRETYVNRTKRHLYGESDVYESRFDTAGPLYRSLLQEHGRCVGKMYIDKDETTQQIGWVFLKRVRYELPRYDKEDTYLQETWVSVHEAPPTHIEIHHYAHIG